MDEENLIYADYNATTPLDCDVQKAMLNSLNSDWGNPSSCHKFGVNARVAIENARYGVAQMVGGNPKEITFTSGGTETNNMVIFGLCSASDNTNTLPHVVTSTVEHDSVILPLKHLQATNKATYTTVELVNGELIVEDVIKAVKDETVLITVMAANNETGVIMPIAEIGAAVQQLNIQRQNRGLQRVLFHTDAAQILGKERVDVKEWNVDCLTIVGHKFYGPRIGALWSRVEIPPLLFGGGQEGGRRPGTENTPMIVGLGCAAKMVSDNIDTYTTTMRNARDQFLLILTEEKFTAGVTVNCGHLSRLPNTANISFHHTFTGSQVLSACKKLIAGVGAACHSTTTQGSPILISSGVQPEHARTAIRISFGRETTISSVREIADDLKQAIAYLHNSNTNDKRETADTLGS